MSNPRGTPENLIPFTKDNQPSPEAKSKGWERRRARIKIKTYKIKIYKLT